MGIVESLDNAASELRKNKVRINEAITKANHELSKNPIPIKLQEKPCYDVEENFLITKYKRDGSVQSSSPDLDFVSDYIIDKFDIKTIFGLKEESIYVYENGVWSLTGKGLIKSEIERVLKNYAKNSVVLEVLEKIKRKTEITRKDFEIVPDFKVCLETGVLDLQDVNNIKLLGHNKKYNFKSRIPIGYNPEEDCPTIKKFIKESVYPKDIEQVQEWFGLHLVRRYLFKKAAICVGAKNTGKTIYLNLLSTFVGENNVSGLSLQKISYGKNFDLLSLKDKFANIFDDLSAKDLNDGGGLKMTVGDGIITGEQKFGDMIRFRNSAKMTFACNKIPPVKEIDDEAYYDRWLIWRFDNVVSQEEKDPQLIDKLTSPNELSGLLNWALEGLKRLVKNNQFSNDRSVEEKKQLMIQSGSPLARFSKEVLEYDLDGKITKDEMYHLFCDFCLNQKPELSPSSKEQLGRQLNRFAPYIRSSKSGSTRYWGNVKIRDTRYTSQKNMSNNLESSKEEENKGKDENKKDIYNFSESVPSVPTEEVLEKQPSQRKASIKIEEIKKYLEENQPVNIEVMKEDLSISDVIIEKMIKKGFAFENPAGKLRLL